jgi:hypothetical protein
VRRLLAASVLALLAASAAACQPAAKAGAGGTSATVSSVAPTIAPSTASSAATKPATVAVPSPVAATPSAAAVPSVTKSASGVGVKVGSTSATAELATLAVKGRAPMTGYTRLAFGPAWPTIAGCDERNDTLRRDLRNITTSGACEVTSGTLVSPYTGATIHFVRGPDSAAVQIDHVVPLGDAWVTGAAYWTASERETFANDPSELLAVDEHSNEAKGDADAASWLPPNKAFRCTYVAIQINVKVKYRLWITPAEHSAMASVLSSCGGVAANTTTATTAAAPRPTVTARSTPTLQVTPTSRPTAVAPVPVKTAPPKPITTTAPASVIVHAGAFCSVAWATGVTSTGKPEVCKTTPKDSRLRWRAA